MLIINSSLSIPLKDLSFSQIKAQGPGGQNVNKVATAVQLRFDIHNSSLPEYLKERLFSFTDRRITKDGVIVITAQNHRTFRDNKEEAIHRLALLIGKAALPRKKRKPTRPSRRSQQKRLDKKTLHGRKKALRQKVH